MSEPARSSSPSSRATGRLAGLAYTGLVLTGIFGLAYVPGQLVTLSDPAATYAKIAASEPLYRAGIAAELICYALFPVLLVFLHRLLAPHGPALAMLMVVFAAVSVPVSFVAVAHKEAVLDIAGGAGAFAQLDVEARSAAMMTEFRAYSGKIGLAEIFWGLWLLPLGLLVIRSAVIPRLLGVLLVLGCLGYLMNYFGPLLFAGYGDSPVGTIVSIPASIGEIGTALWLAVFGARDPATG